MKKQFALLVFSIFCLLGMAAQAQKMLDVKQPKFKKFFKDETLRIDYYRIGNSHFDSISLVREMSATPTKAHSGWAGSKTILLDPFDYGDFRVVVKDIASGREIYSRTYNSLFREYRDTPQGKDSVAVFEEVVNIPMPINPAKVIFQRRNERQKFVNQAVFTWTAEKDWLALDPNLGPEPIQLQYKGAPSEKIDVAIVAEGYGPGEEEKMQQDLRLFMEYMFGQEPFKSRRDDFNVWGVARLGETSGITDPCNGVQVNSICGATFNTFNSCRYLMSFKLFQLHDLLCRTPCDHIIIMANSKTYGGGAIYNFYAVSAVTEMAGMILPHELGHSIGGLADEYVDPDLSYNGMHKEEYEPLEPNITSLVDFKSKWEDMIEEDTPIPTPPCTLSNRMDNCGPVGVYEGAGYKPKGLYRPVMNCMMNYYAPFCPVCTKALNAIFDIYCK